MRTNVVAPVRKTAAMLLLLVAACDRPAERLEALSEALRPTPTASFVPAVPDDHRTWLALYDEAGFPDVSALRRVEFEVGRSRSGDDDEPTIELERAWVLSTSPLVLLQDSLWTLEPERGVEVPESMQAPSPNSPETLHQPPCEPLAYREVDFADELRAELEAVEALTAADYPFAVARRLVPPATYWLVRARWAEMRGLPELSRRALAQVERWTIIYCAEIDQACSPRDAIRFGFHHNLLWQATDGIASFMPRPQVREFVARAQSMAQDGDDAARASELLDRLDQTIATDANGPPWPDDGEPARVQRLIHLLREQNGHQPARPSVCDPFAVRGPIRDPAAELVALGREAIPALIDHIDDDTLTRSVDNHRHVLSVGDVSLEIIEQIAGRSFDVDQMTSSDMSREDRARAVKQLVREWWAGVHELSQREQLLHDLDNVEVSERSRIADRLLETYGMEIWPQLTRAFQETQDDSARRSLLLTMNQAVEREASPHAGRRRSNDIERFLIAALGDRSASVRLAAAQALGERGRHDGRETIIRDLDRYWLEPDAWGYYDAYESYFEVLVADGSPAAVDAIDRAIQHRGYGALVALRAGGCRWFKPCAPQLDGAAKARLLDTLAGYLDDFGDPGGSYGLGPARVRDMAAAAYLALTGRDTDALASLPTSIERDRMILDMLNAHRAQQRRAPVSWPHVAPPQGTPGRDHVQRVHLNLANVHEAAAREWLASFADRDLDPQPITTALVELAQRHPDVPFTLRIHRFPDHVGVILTLEVGAREPSSSGSRGATESFAACRGADCGGGSSSVTNEPAAEVFADFLHDHLAGAWNREPTRIEEYIFRAKVSSAKSSGLADLRCACTVDEHGDRGWLLSFAGLLPAGRLIQRARRRRRDARVQVEARPAIEDVQLDPGHADAVAVAR